MKIQAYYLLIAFLLTALVTSCDNKGYPQQLIVADSLADISPQQSLKILDKWQQSSPNASKHDRMFAGLVRYKAEDKAYIAHKPADTVSIKSIVNYYKLHDNHLLTEAYFYAGSLYRDLYDYPTALKYFQLARTNLPTNAKAELKYKIYSQIGDIFKAQDMTKESKDMNIQALKYCKQMKDTLKIINILSNIAYKYQVLKQNDSAEIYIRRAEHYANQYKNEIELENVIERKAALFYNRKDYHKALNEIRLLTNRNIQKKDKSVRYAVLRDVYHAVGMDDSATIYCKLSLRYGDIDSKVNSYYILFQIYDKQGRKDEASYNLQKYKEYEDSVKRLNNAQEIAKQNAIYNYNSVLKEKSKLQADVVAFTISAIIVFIICIGLSYHHFRYRAQTKKKLEEKEKQLKEAFLEHKRQKEMQLRENRDETSVSIDHVQKIRDFNNIVQVHLENNQKLSTEEWEILYEIFNDIYPKFKENIYCLAKLDKHSYNICMLTKMNFAAKDIAILTVHTTNAISLAKKRIYKKLTGIEGVPKDLDKLMNKI